MLHKLEVLFFTIKTRMRFARARVTCRVCGHRIQVSGAQRYTAVEQNLGGLAAAFNGNQTRLADAFDCPRCGCQCVVQTRLPKQLDDESEKEV